MLAINKYFDRDQIIINVKNTQYYKHIILQ